MNPWPTRPDQIKKSPGYLTIQEGLPDDTRLTRADWLWFLATVLAFALYFIARVNP